MRWASWAPAASAAAIAGRILRRRRRRPRRGDRCATDIEQVVERSAGNSLATNRRKSPIGTQGAAATEDSHDQQPSHGSARGRAAAGASLLRCRAAGVRSYASRRRSGRSGSATRHPQQRLHELAEDVRIRRPRSPAKLKVQVDLHGHRRRSRPDHRHRTAQPRRRPQFKAGKRRAGQADWSSTRRQGRLRQGRGTRLKLAAIAGSSYARDGFGVDDDQDAEADQRRGDQAEQELGYAKASRSRSGRQARRLGVGRSSSRARSRSCRRQRPFDVDTGTSPSSRSVGVDRPDDRSARRRTGRRRRSSASRSPAARSGTTAYRRCGPERRRPRTGQNSRPEPTRPRPSTLSNFSVDLAAKTIASRSRSPTPVPNRTSATSAQLDRRHHARRRGRGPAARTVTVQNATADTAPITAKPERLRRSRDGELRRTAGRRRSTGRPAGIVSATVRPSIGSSLHRRAGAACGPPFSCPRRAGR